MRERSKHVVRFKTIKLEDWYVEIRNQLACPRKLAYEFVGGTGTVGFVVVKHIVPKSGAFFIERHGVMRRLLVSQHLQQHRREPVNSIDQFPRAPHCKRREGVKSAVNQVVAVYQEQPRFLRIRHEIIIAETENPNPSVACRNGISGRDSKRKSHLSPTLFPFMI